MTVAGREVGLRAREFDLLARLAAEPGVAVSRATLMADVWDDHWSGSTKTLDVHVAAVRRKLGGASASLDLRVPGIATVRGHGYRLELDPDRPNDPRYGWEPTGTGSGSGCSGWGTAGAAG